MTRRTLCLIVLLPLCGCLTTSKITPTRYYTADPIMNITAVAPSAQTLGVRPLTVARPFKTPMAYRDATQQIAFRPNDEWAENPGNMVTRTLIDAMAALGRFKDAGNAADMARPDLMLTGEVRKFQENRQASPATAEIEIRLELRAARANGVLWAATLSAQAPMESDSADAFAAAMSRALGRIAELAAEGIAKTPLPE